MKKLILPFLLMPLLLRAQDAGNLIFEITTLTPDPGKVAGFQSTLAAHNKNFHASPPHGVRVYSVISGRSTGSIKWVKGPYHWTDLDSEPAGTEAHDLDWNNNVMPNLLPTANTQYLRLDAKHSRFARDFDISKLLIWTWDIKPNADWPKVNTLLDNIHRVFAEKLPDELYGVYHNELGSTRDGDDLSMVFFFDSFSWMGIDNGFNEKYEEIFGAGSWKTFLEDWSAQVLGRETEMWVFRQDLSGLGPRIVAAERQ